MSGSHWISLQVIRPLYQNWKCQKLVVTNVLITSIDQYFITFMFLIYSICTGIWICDLPCGVCVSKWGSQDSRHVSFDWQEVLSGELQSWYEIHQLEHVCTFEKQKRTQIICARSQINFSGKNIHDTYSVIVSKYVSF